MRKLIQSISFIAFILLAGINFASCSSDSNNEPTKEDMYKTNIIGIWNIRTADIIQPEHPGEELARYLAIVNIEFKSGGEVSWYEWDYTTNSPAEIPTKGTYSINGDKLVIQSSTPGILVNTFTIEELASSYMKLYVKNSKIEAYLELH